MNTDYSAPPATSTLLRIATAGSVDDGKSTLVGRLLYDSKALHEDQVAALTRLAQSRGLDEPDLALLTDGLRAEREQGITIDVAYRYFATPRRTFIIADTPGHVQYTRNMVTGASTAHLAIVLVDARNGVVTQSRRHGFIAALLRTPHVLLAVNKMDLVDYDEVTFRAIAHTYAEFAQQVGIPALTCIPIAALQGDNVVERSAHMHWYRGPSLLEHLETVEIPADVLPRDLRLPVQLALRPHAQFRGVAGQIASGRIEPGDAVRVLPSGARSRVRSVLVGGSEVKAAEAGDSVVVTLEDDVDAGRGDLIVQDGREPEVTDRIESTLCWLGEEPLDPRREYILQHTTHTTYARLDAGQDGIERIDVDTLARMQVATLALNEIGRAWLRTAQPLAFDPYAANRVTGAFILIDPHTHNTVAAGMIERATPRPDALRHLVWEEAAVALEEREARNGHAGAVLWFTGLSGAGKSTLAQRVERRLFALGAHTFRLDGDNVRHGLNADLGFDDAGRRENIRRVANVARLAQEHGAIVLCTFISPFRADRAAARALLPEGRFLEIYVRCGLEECERRDPKGLYARARRGEIPQFTGISSPYEEPDAPEIVADTAQYDAETLADQILRALRSRGIMNTEEF